MLLFNVITPLDSSNSGDKVSRRLLARTGLPALRRRNSSGKLSFFGSLEDEGLRFQVVCGSLVCVLNLAPPLLMWLRRRLSSEVLIPPPWQKGRVSCPLVLSSKEEWWALTPPVGHCKIFQGLSPCNIVCRVACWIHVAPCLAVCELLDLSHPCPHEDFKTAGIRL